MIVKELGRRLEVVAKVLISVSLFLVLIWWRGSVLLFVLGSAILVVTWLMDDALVAASPIARE